MQEPSNLGAPTEAAWSYGDVPPPHRRRHRWLTLPSSSVVVLALFLPFFKVCGEPKLAIQLPMFCSPHVIAALVFAATLARPRAHGAYALALRIIIWITVAVFLYIAMNAFADGDLLEPLPLLGLVALVGLVSAVFSRGEPEVVVARCGASAGVTSVLWFGAVALSKDGLWGAWVSAIAASAMTIGCGWWWYEAEARVPPPARLLP